MTISVEAPGLRPAATQRTQINFLQPGGLGRIGWHVGAFSTIAPILLLVVGSLVFLGLHSFWHGLPKLTSGFKSWRASGSPEPDISPKLKGN